MAGLARADEPRPGVRGVARRVWAPRGGEVDLAPISQPPAAPELNPAERGFQELRRAIAGPSCPNLEAKLAVVERELAALAADPARRRQLTGWAWIVDALSPLIGQQSV